ncbi:MAG: hypothetical protein QM770_24955 [Tepidisphaeraceae bacterium]
MFTRLLVLAAVGVYLTAFGCSLLRSTPAPVSRNHPTTTLPHGVKFDAKPIRAIGMQIQRVDWMDKYKKSIDEIAAVGADTVKFVVDSRQENGSSSRIYLDMRMTPTPDQLGDLIRYAKSKNLRVILMPIVLLDKPRGGEWRGQIKPESWDTWWDSYREVLNHFAWIAQGNGADVLVIGSELVSTEGKTEEWRETIRKVREIYKGYITYSSNWDHYDGIAWWDDLDLVGMNSYWKLGDDENVTVQEIEDNWKPIQQRVLEFAASKGKPLLLLEVGWCSQANAAKEPWDYTQDSQPIDDDLQKRLYEGFFNVWYGSPGMAGFSMWEWTPGDGGKDTDDGPKRGYTPENKPAEGVLKEWFAKEWKK